MKFVFIFLLFIATALAQVPPVAEVCGEVGYCLYGGKRTTSAVVGVDGHTHLVDLCVDISIAEKLDAATCGCFGSCPCGERLTCPTGLVPALYDSA